MADRQQLAIRNDIAASPLTNLTVRDMLQLGSSLVGTGFLPATIKTPEQAMAIMLKGQELRVPPMYSLSNIVIVQGKPSCSAELMLALIQRDFGQRAVRVKDSTDQSCTVEYRLDGWDDIQSYAFTIQQAEQAGLFKNAVWKSYPAAMLRARCISAVARMAFPGSIGGMYVPGELGEAVTVTSDGEIVSTATMAVQAPQGGNVPLQAHSMVDEDVTTAPATIRRAPEEVSQAVPDRGKVMQRLHSYVPHDALHNWAISEKYGSVSDMPIDTLIDMGKSFKTGGATAFMAQHAPAAGQSTIDGLDDLHAQLDRQQAAERARQ